MEIKEEAGNAFSDVALMKWESGKNQPRTENLKALLKVYNCNLEDIAEPSDLALN